MTENDTIAIFGREESDDRGLLKLSDYLYERKAVNVDTLKERIAQFLTAMREVVAGTPDEFGQFDLEAVTITAEVSAKGQVSLLGTGGEAAGKGGISFTLKRVPARQS